MMRNPNITCEFTEADWEWWYKKEQSNALKNQQKIICGICEKEFNKILIREHRETHQITFREYRLLKKQLHQIITKKRLVQTQLDRLIRKIEHTKKYKKYRKKLNLWKKGITVQQESN